MICVIDRALASNSASRARAASSSSGEGVADADGVAEGVGDGDEVGLDDAPGEADGFGEAEVDRAGEAEGLANGEAEGEPEGLAAGDGDALADGAGVTGGVGEGVDVGSSAFAYAGKMARSAKPNAAPSRNVRNIHRRDCTRALTHPTQVHPTDERSAVLGNAYFRTHEPKTAVCRGSCCRDRDPGRHPLARD